MFKIVAGVGESQKSGQAKPVGPVPTLFKLAQRAYIKYLSDKKNKKQLLNTLTQLHIPSHFSGNLAETLLGDAIEPSAIGKTLEQFIINLATLTDEDVEDIKHRDFSNSEEENLGFIPSTILSPPYYIQLAHVLFEVTDPSSGERFEQYFLDTFSFSMDTQSSIKNTRDSNDSSIFQLLSSDKQIDWTKILRAIPQFLRKLEVTNTHLSEIPGPFPSLLHLSLSSSRNTAINLDKLSSYPNLLFLDLSGQNYRLGIPPILFQLSKLKKLHLNYCELRQLDPAPFKKLGGLCLLSIIGNPWLSEANIAEVKDAIEEGTATSLYVIRKDLKFV